MSDCILKRYTGYRYKGRLTSVIVPLSNIKVTPAVFSQWIEIPQEDAYGKMFTKEGVQDE